MERQYKGIRILEVQLRRTPVVDVPKGLESPGPGYKEIRQILPNGDLLQTFTKIKGRERFKRVP